MGKSPGGAVEIVDADPGLVFIRNGDEAIYRCPECWQQAELLNEPLLDSSYECTADVRPPEPPGIVIHEFSDTECYADVRTYFTYVVLEDGSVWEWTNTGGWTDMFIFSMFGIAGCLIGTLAAFFGTVIFQLYWFTRKKRAALAQHLETPAPQ